MSVVGEPGVGGFDDPAFPESDEFDGAGSWLSSWYDVEFVDAVFGGDVVDGVVAEASVEVKGADVAGVAGCFEFSESGSQEGVVVAVCSSDDPGQRNAGLVDADDPFPSLFAPVRWVETGSFTTAGCLVVGTVESDMIELKANDFVVGGKGFGAEPLEDSCFDPFISSCPQSRVRYSVIEDTFDTCPRHARDETKHDSFEHDPVRDSWTVSAKGMFGWFW